MSSRKVKGSAAVFRRFLNSPVTSSDVGGRSPATQGVPMLFRQRRRLTLGDAISMMNRAIEVAYRFLRERGHAATTEDLELLDKLAATCFANYTTAQYISRKVHERSQGEVPENPTEASEP
jgi:hypothetical protein